MEKKMTKKDMFATIAKLADIVEIANTVTEDTAADVGFTVNEIVKDAGITAEEMKNFCQHEIELLEKKTSKSGQTKTQKANTELKDAIYAELVRIGKPIQIKELQKVSPVCKDLSTSKISAMMRQLGTEHGDGRVEKVVEKKVSYFSAVVPETADAPEETAETAEQETE